MLNTRKRNYNEAITAYLNASKTLTGPIVCYNLAGVYALSGDKENAYKWLEKAVEKGFRQYRTMEKDSDFESIKNEKDLTILLRK